MPREGWLLRPDGPVPHDVADRWMHELAARRLAQEIPDTLILLEHPPVYTAGRRSKPEDLVWTEDAVRAAGADLRHIDRGGSFTFHGPGQLVGYPILDLGGRPNAIDYVRRLEEVVIRAASDLGIALERSCVQTGVWSGDLKVSAIGVRIKRMRVTLHGFAVNCTTDLSWFDAIVPCGLSQTGVTSLSDLGRRAISVEELEPLVVRRFEEVFDLALRRRPRARTAGWTRATPDRREPSSAGPIRRRTAAGS